MLDYRSLLEMEGLDPASTLIVRHNPVEKSLRRVLPWLVTERPDLWLAYQRIQWESLEKAMTKAAHIAAFIGDQPGKATLAGIYRIGSSQVLDYARYCAFPGNRELEAYGMSERSPNMPDCRAFNLEALDIHADWTGRLVIAWPTPHQNWWRWAKGGTFAVEAIAEESRFALSMPDWHDLILNWTELQALPRSWQLRLAQWRGVYFIFDAERRAGYVGSAAGSDNILGRWRDYATTGHGGNRELRASDPANLRFSILQLTSPDLPAGELVALEDSWKQRLHTREFGLNRN